MKNLVERMEEMAKTLESLGETREEINSVSKMDEIVRSMEAGARMEIMMPALEAMEAGLEKEMRGRMESLSIKIEPENRPASSSLRSMCYKLRHIAHNQLDNLLANR